MKKKDREREEEMARKKKWNNTKWGWFSSIMKRAHHTQSSDNYQMNVSIYANREWERERKNRAKAGRRGGWEIEVNGKQNQYNKRETEWK